MLAILFYAFLSIVILQLLYYLIIFGKFAFAKEQKSTAKRIPISVIVCAKNEEENVLKYIPLLAEQNYPDFEIILINDASSDTTLDIFEDFEKQYPNVRLVNVINNEAFWGNKKYALTLGIKAAKKEYLLFTNADCYPTSKDWITSMSSQFTMSKTIVLGYSGYEKIANSFLNKIIRFENVRTAMQYFSWAKNGNPYMGTGRNLAYKKEEWFNVNGFISHMKVRTGDDDLFINQAANRKNTAICFVPESFTYSKPKTKFKEWLEQRKRETSTIALYNNFDKVQLTVFNSSQSLFLLLSIVLLAFQFNWMIVLPIVILRYIVTYITFGFSAKKFKEKDIIYWYPILEIILIFIQLNMFTSNLFSKPSHWK
ncbi:glycosyltransferase [Flavobacterium sp. '19STA2R22 D10 B1']|uniref:glycosyltransferase n=1 Tax=Flavobacterium aerium TaxID=3037261 RepID=UPI00278C4CB1|nr:glycosyltransferase [Flavobacterium sp. '19STA2R22 D10 B1']